MHAADASRPMKTPGRPPGLRALLLAIFVSSMPGTIVLPMLPSLGAEFGASGAKLGILFGIYPLMSVVASPIWGRFSDRYGRRPALIGTLIGSAIAFTAFGLANSYAGLLLARAIQGLAGSSRGIGFAVISDTTEGHERGAGMGYVSAAMAVGFTVGPVLGALLLGEHPTGMLAWLRAQVGAPPTGFDHLLPSLLGAALNLVGLAVVVAGFRETRRGGVSRKPSGARPSAGRRGQEAPGDSPAVAAGTGTERLAIDFRMGVMIALFLVAGFIQGTIQFSFAYWADQALHWTAREIALAFSALGLGFVLSTGGLLRPVLRRLDSERTVLAGVLVDFLGIGLFSLAGSASGPFAVGCLVLSTLGSALWGTTILSLLSRDAAEHHQGTVLGIANGASLIGRVAGPPVAGFLAARFGALSPFLAILACQVVILGRAFRLVQDARLRTAG